MMCPLAVLSLYDGDLFVPRKQYSFQTIYYRYTVGLFGSVCCILAIKGLTTAIPTKLLFFIAKIGRNTLGIYIISDILFNTHILRTISIDMIDNSYTVAFVETVFIVAICQMLTVLIRRYSLVNRILLGGR